MNVSNYLTILTFIGLVVGFVGGLVSQLSQTSIDGPDGKKTLTTAGKLALAIAAVGFAGSFASELLKASIAASDAASLKLERAQQEQRRRDDDQWKRRSSEIEQNILSQTNSALGKQEANLEATITGFQRSQEQNLQTQLSVIEARTRILSPIGQSKVSIWLTLDCASSRFSLLCQKVKLLSPEEQTSSGTAIWSLWPSTSRKFEFIVCAFNTKSRAEEFVFNHTKNSDCDTTYAIYSQAGQSDSTVQLMYVNGKVQLSLRAYRLRQEDVRGDGKTESMDDLPERAIVLLSYDDNTLVGTKMDSVAFFNDTGRSFAIVECPRRYFRNSLHDIFGDQVQAQLPAFECTSRNVHR